MAMHSSSQGGAMRRTYTTDNTLQPVYQNFWKKQALGHVLQCWLKEHWPTDLLLEALHAQVQPAGNPTQELQAQLTAQYLGIYLYMRPSACAGVHPSPVQVVWHANAWPWAPNLRNNRTDQLKLPTSAHSAGAGHHPHSHHSGICESQEGRRTTPLIVLTTSSSPAHTLNTSQLNPKTREAQ
jgi:hypothetical protein